MKVINKIYFIYKDLRTWNYKIHLKNMFFKSLH